MLRSAVFVLVFMEFSFHISTKLSIQKNEIQMESQAVSTDLILSVVFMSTALVAINIFGRIGPHFVNALNELQKTCYTFRHYPDYEFQSRKIVS